MLPPASLPEERISPALISPCAIKLIAPPLFTEKESRLPVVVSIVPPLLRLIFPPPEAIEPLRVILLVADKTLSRLIFPPPEVIEPLRVISLVADKITGPPGVERFPAVMLPR